MKKILILITFIISFSLVNVEASELNCSKSLVKGNKGNNVLLLQNNLNEIIDCSLDEDGIFGNKTLSCVKKFQQKYGIKTTGNVGRQTCNKINSLIKKNTVTTNNKFNCSNNITSNSEKNIIKKMQSKLNTIMDCNLEEDGVYGKATKACIRKFQIEYNLDDTGKMDTTTCKKLTSSDTLNNKEKTLNVPNKSIIIKDNNAKIMKSTNDNSNVLKTLEFGDIYQYTSIKIVDGINWYKVSTNNGYGYIKEEYIEKNFIVVDISQQKLILYKNNQALLNAKVVTGTYNKHDTPTGYNILRVKNLIDGKYLIGYKPDGTLDYKSWVDYWMPFITKRGIGFHDASWRTSSEYTNTRYMYDGSHGCVNMMKNDAKKLFNNITSDIAVIVRN